MTKIMRAGLWIALLAAGAGGCKKKAADEAGKTGSAPASGSAPGTASGSAPGTASGSAAATPMTPEQVATWYASCWGHFNAHKWDDFKACYAADAVADDLGNTMTLTGADAVVANAQAFGTGFADGKGEQQLTLVNGTHVASITLFTGTQDAPLKGPGGDIPATKQKVGILMFHAVDADAGKVTHEWSLMDMASFLGQLGLMPKEVPFRAAITASWPERPVVIAKGDDAEKANVAAYRAGLEVFNKHDLAGLTATFAPDAVWSEQTMPADQTVAEMTKGLESFWAGFSDMKLEAATVWGAGDYVVAVGTASGTNDGKAAEMGLDKTGKKFTTGYVEIDQLKDGKVVHAWLFTNSVAIAEQLGLMPPPPGAPPAPAPAP